MKYPSAYRGFKPRLVLHNHGLGMGGGSMPLVVDVEPTQVQYNNMPRFIGIQLEMIGWCAPSDSVFLRGQHVFLLFDSIDSFTDGGTLVRGKVR